MRTGTGTASGSASVSWRIWLIERAGCSPAHRAEITNTTRPTTPTETSPSRETPRGTNKVQTTDIEAIQARADSHRSDMRSMHPLSGQRHAGQGDPYGSVAPAVGRSDENED